MARSEKLEGQPDGVDARFRAPLMAYFMRKLGNRSEAEDLTQEVFARLLGSASFARTDESQPRDEAQAYVFRVASNLLHDKARTARRWKMHTLAGEDQVAIADTAGSFVEDRSPERVLIGRERLAEVAAGLDEIDDRARSIFLLFRVDGLKQKEIARLCGVSVSTVEKSVISTLVHLARALRREPP